MKGAVEDTACREYIGYLSGCSSPFQTPPAGEKVTTRLKYIETTHLINGKRGKWRFALISESWLATAAHGTNYSHPRTS
jgi:hypothetical protein